MDSVLVDFESGINKLDEKTKIAYPENKDEVPGIFELMEPFEGAIEAAHALSDKYEVYILSTAPWLNPSAWIDKIKWVHKYFGVDESSIFYKRLILSHHKNLNKGDYLIDDRTANGAGEFTGELLEFGGERFPDWNSITNYLLGS